MEELGGNARRTANGQAGGGVGNPGGKSVGNDNSARGADGTGGLLIVYADIMNNNGSITAQGVTNKGQYGGVGGSSGGGSVNIFYKSKINIGYTSADGGSRGINANSNFDIYSGAGGNGTVSKGSIATGSYVGE